MRPPYITATRSDKREHLRRGPPTREVSALPSARARAQLIVDELDGADVHTARGLRRESTVKSRPISRAMTIFC